MAPVTVKDTKWKQRAADSHGKRRALQGALNRNLKLNFVKFDVGDYFRSSLTLNSRNESN